MCLDVFEQSKIYLFFDIVEDIILQRRSNDFVIGLSPVIVPVYHIPSASQILKDMGTVSPGILHWGHCVRIVSYLEETVKGYGQGF